ncbi:hypothetical protein TRL7639_02284 [Falsiruegeria litorea R37]|uniref:DUF1499 domain-containing protein n=1 Tax=Falsiruegeria litorea R37 TaxID=1200284 RepID=A0A1Y5SLS5_9RHOB|nr:DUF1499 domain-containing protein [Falsiruegeria litorea]SLN43539.1 hypothetical protein TRL7639_02284 [Falsiruegeria litorea R37]
MTVAWVLLTLMILGVAFIRLAPSDPVRWHVAPKGDADKDLKGGVVRVVQAGQLGLKKFNTIVQADATTRVLAGSVDEGMVTYISRTKVMGFPDYTTAQQDGDTLRIYGRLRFGRSDMGVNRKRVDGWLRQLPSSAN